MCCLKSLVTTKLLVVVDFTNTVLKSINYGPALIFYSCSPVSSRAHSLNSVWVEGSDLNFFFIILGP
jgi:hypothetical protein